MIQRILCALGFHKMEPTGVPYVVQCPICHRETCVYP